jgi:hypothetical protein
VVSVDDIMQHRGRGVGLTHEFVFPWLKIGWFYVGQRSADNVKIWRVFC